MEQEELIAKAMIAMGWSPEAEVPMASEENLALFKELAALTEERANLESVQKQNAERVDKLQQHAKNAEVSINHNLKLLLAYQEEVRTENHLFKITERERSKLKEDLKNTDKELEQITKYEQTTEKEVCKFRHRIDDLTNRIKWAKAAMQEWTEAVNDGDKGMQLIEKYCKEDEIKAKEQELLRCKLSRKIEDIRATLVVLYDEQKSLEQNLDCTSNLYRTSHVERLKMVETWKSAVNQMTQREEDITNGEYEVKQLKKQSKKQDAERKNYDNKLNDIILNNRTIEAEIEELNTSSSEIKEQIQQLANLVILKENEVDIVQKELQALSNRVLQQRSENSQNMKQKLLKLKALEEFDGTLEKLEQHYASMESKTMSAQQRLQVLEDMNDNEQKVQQQLNNDIDRLNGLVYRAQQQLVKFKSDQKTMEVANRGVEATTGAIVKNFSQIEHQLKRQTEIHYEAAFKCLELERRLIQLQGGNTDPEQEERNKQYLAQLEEKHAKVLKKMQMTETQNGKLDDGMRKLTMSFNDDSKAMELMQFKVKEAEVYCEGGVKRLKEELRANQLLMVELSIVKMRVHEFEEQIAKSEEDSYNLEKHRMQLNRTIKDRMVEIKSQMDLLRLKSKHLEEERSTLRADIGERRIRINAVKARFELTSKLLGCNEDGTLVTATQLKVEMAQEKQMLLDEGNDLNERVIKAEEDIKAMENTLNLFNNSNNIYRQNFKQIDDPDQAAMEAKHLQKTYCQALTHLKGIRNKILSMQQENEKAELKKDELEKSLDVLISKRMENEKVLAKLQNEIQEQNIKIQRADREMKLALKTLKQRAISADYLALFEKELDLQELEDRNKQALNQLSDFAETNEEIGPKIIRMLDQAGIQTLRMLHKSRSVSSWRSLPSESSLASSRDAQSSRSSFSLSSKSIPEETSTRVSLVSIEFDDSAV